MDATPEMLAGLHEAARRANDPELREKAEREARKRYVTPAALVGQIKTAKPARTQ